MAYTATDREQIEEIKKWWREYGKSITLAVIVGLLIGFAWRYWHVYVAAQETAASAIYQNMDQAAWAKQSDLVTADAMQLKQHYRHTVYASLGSFLEARMAVEQGRYANADAALSWVIAHERRVVLKQIARIRDARVLLQMGKVDAAQRILAIIDDPVYQPMIDAVMSDIYTAQGNSAAAALALQRSKTAYDTTGLQNPWIDLRAHP